MAGRDGQLVVDEHADVEDVIARATAEFGPFVARVCLFSGGNDSGVLAHRCADFYDELVFIDTGTALPGVRAHVEGFAAQIGKPLRVYEAGDAWRNLVLAQGGFPGPGGHGRAYTRLKERQIEAALRDLKGGRHAGRVMFLSGKRRAESARRSKTTLGADRKRGQVYVNPLVNWSNEQMRTYRVEHRLPQSDVAALIHRSGECNCGAFAAKGEREMLQQLWPEWFERVIASLEREAEAFGVPACRWGQAPPKDRRDQDRLFTIDGEGALCSSCEWRSEEAVPDAA